MSLWDLALALVSAREAKRRREERPRPVHRVKQSGILDGLIVRGIVRVIDVSGTGTLAVFMVETDPDVVYRVHVRADDSVVTIDTSRYREISGFLKDVSVFVTSGGLLALVLKNVGFSQRLTVDLEGDFEVVRGYYRFV